MNLFLIRHGQSTGNLGRPGAPRDPALTPVGHEQAKCAAQALACESIMALYASPMTRALQTAQPISELLGLPVRVWPELAETPRAEWNNPDAGAGPAYEAGLTPGEVGALLPSAEFDENLSGDAAWWEAQRGEKRAAAYARAERVIERLRGVHSAEEEGVAVVTHGAFGSVLLSVALSAPPTDYNRFSQYNCGISLLRCTKDGVRLRFLNRADHLAEALRTDLTY